MNLCIFHSVNSGLYLWDGERGLLIDGVFDGREQGLSAMPRVLGEQLNRREGLFAHVDGALFTHLHADHFWRPGLCRLLEGPNPPAVYGPGLAETGVSSRPERPGISRIQLPGATVWSRDTLHEGRCYQDTPHQSYLIRMGGSTAFVAGDAVLQVEDAEAFSGLCDGEIELGFFNPYQLVSLQSREFLQILRPNRILLVHLPFQEDDRYHYWSFAKQCVRKFSGWTPTLEVVPHMAWLDGKSAAWAPNTDAPFD